MGRIEDLISILRRITLVVRVFPFIYTALYLVLYAAYAYGYSSTMLDIIDYLVFVSPVVVVAHLFYSKTLKLCKWHRMACALPLIPQAVDLLDNYWWHLSEGAWIVVMSTIGVTLVFFAFCVYKVFFTDEGKIC